MPLTLGMTQWVATFDQHSHSKQAIKTYSSNIANIASMKVCKWFSGPHSAEMCWMCFWNSNPAGLQAAMAGLNWKNNQWPVPLTVTTPKKLSCHQELSLVINLIIVASKCLGSSFYRILQTRGTSQPQTHQALLQCPMSPMEKLKHEQQNYQTNRYT